MKRTLTSILILIVVGGMIALREVHTAFFDAFVLLLMLASGFEFVRAYKKMGKPIFERLVIFYPIPVAVGYIFTESILTILMIQICTFIVIFLVAMGIELIVYGVNAKTGAPAPETDSLLATTKNTVWVMFYPLTIISFMFMLNHFGNNLNMGYVVLITMFAISMLTDTLAYLVGIMFGKKSGKMAAYISPNKSIAGMIGGIVGGLIGGMLCFVLFYTLDLLPCGLTVALSTGQAVALFSMSGILGSFATQFGDLVESAVKRKAGIKDMGRLLPGHGGIMDRIDGEIFCSVIVVVMFSLFLAL